MPNLLINGKRIKMRGKHADSLLKLSGRRLIISTRKDLREIDSLREKIEDLEKKVSQKKKAIRIEMIKEVPQHGMDATDIRRIIKEELSTLQEPKERKILIARRMPTETGKKMVRLRQEHDVVTAEDYKEKKRQVKGISIPQIHEEKYEEEKSDISSLSMKYPLVPRNPKPGERVYAYANIFFDRTRNEMVYNLVEPAMDEKKKFVLEEIKDYIQEKIDVNFGQ